MLSPVYLIRLGLLLCSLGAMAAICAQEASTARDIAAMMKASRLSEGFQARMRVTAADSDAPHTLKLAVVGQSDGSRARLAMRVISPEAMRNQSIVAQYRDGAQPSAVAYGEHGDAGDLAIDPYMTLFGTQLVPADMFAIWWDWPQQTLGESMHIAGKDCTVVHSRSGTLPGPLREVDSCVDVNGKLSLRTQIFGAGHKILRTITVEKTMRKEDGAAAARRLTIKAEDGTTSIVEVYDGDEHYRPTTETFSPAK
jgi:hypothetical protein